MKIINTNGIQPIDLQSEIYIDIYFIKDAGATECTVNWFESYLPKGFFVHSIAELIQLVERSSRPTSHEVEMLLKYCQVFRTPETLEYFKSLFPTAREISRLMCACPEYQTVDMVKFFLRSGPHTTLYHYMYHKFFSLFVEAEDEILQRLSRGD